MRCAREKETRARGTFGTQERFGSLDRAPTASSDGEQAGATRWAIILFALSARKVDL